MREKPKPSTPKETSVERTTASEFEAALFAAELGGAPEIDLHGQSTDLALSEMETFLHAHLMSGSEVVRIIHGRGEQILRNSIMKRLGELKKQELVAAFRDTTNPAQQGAVTLVALHRIPRQR
jgi:DNA-nicking Smr family endonuclease